MKKIVLKLYEFDELSKDSQERIIEREHWNVMEQCMDAYGIDYKKSMKAFEDMTDTRVYNWEVGYERYDFSYEFKYKDPIYEHPTDYHRDIFPENLCGKLLFRYINNNIMPYIIKGKYFSTSGKYIDGKYKYRHKYSRVMFDYGDTGDDQRTTIKLSLSINDDDNDNVFYYCNGIESLKSLVEYGVGEFIVIDCWSFFSIDNL